MTSHSDSHNCGEYVDIGGYRQQENIQSHYCNMVTRVHVEGRGGYSSPASHYLPTNQGKNGRLLTFSGDTVGGDRGIGYRFQTSQYYPQRRCIRGESARHGIRSEEINHYSSFIVG